MKNFELEHLRQAGVTLEEYNTIKSEAPVDAKRQIEEHGLTMVEYAAIVLRLGRHPNRLELELFGTMWCEHSGYVHSKPLLKAFDRVNTTVADREGIILHLPLTKRGDHLKPLPILVFSFNF